MLLVQLVLVAWRVVAGLSLLAPSPGVALVLMAISAVWLPVNNGHLEGPVLYRADVHHGLTVADLLTYLGFALCVLAGLRWRRFRLRSRGPRGRAGPGGGSGVRRRVAGPTRRWSGCQLAQGTSRHLVIAGD